VDWAAINLLLKNNPEQFAANLTMAIDSVRKAKNRGLKQVAGTLVPA
jgi:hypothetical protein